MNKPKLLFVLSADHGELSNALYFLRGRGSDAALLLPQPLYSLNENRLPVRSYPYSNAQEVLELLDAESPDVVFLFSGYLFAINNLFEIESVAQLVAQQRSLGRAVVTSDPFLGVLRSHGASIFSDRHPRKDWLVRHFDRLLEIFADVWHIYLTSTAEASGGKVVSFFNSNTLIPPGATDPRDEPFDRLPRKPWLFVLSREDYGTQVTRHGQAGFDAMLVRLLRETVAEGRRPVLIAPPACGASIQDKAAALHGLVLAPACSHEVFMSWLLAAEYAFFWNLFSNSIAPRLINRLPVFFFDPGHMARAVPPLLAAGIAHYFAGAEPDFLKAGESLASEELARLATRQEHALQQARDSFRASPSPEAVLATLLRSRQSS